MTIHTDYLEPVYVWRDWETDPDRPDFKPSDDGTDLQLLGVVGIACSYEVWAVNYLEGGTPTEVIVTIGDEGLPGRGGGIMRRWTMPPEPFPDEARKWANFHGWTRLIMSAAMRWTLEYALNSVELEGLY